MGPLVKTILVVSIANVSYRVMYALLNKDVDIWKFREHRYSHEVTLSSTVGFSTSLVAAFYDKYPFRILVEDVAISTFGGWVVGNLIWLSDASLLGESLVLTASDFIPKFRI
jgi:hypothetical protein